MFSMQQVSPIAINGLVAVLHIKTYRPHYTLCVAAHNVYLGR